jgi:hypothetical protein
MNNYWMTNFRAYQEEAFSWSYQLTSTADTSKAFAAKFGWSERNPFPTRTFPAGADDLKIFSMGTLKTTGSANVMLMNSRPAFKDNKSILLRFREVEGLSGEVVLSAAVPGKTISSISEVNAVGVRIGQPIKSVKFKPYEVRFIEVTF